MPKRSKMSRPAWAQRALNARTGGHPWKNECPSHKIRYRDADEAELSAKMSANTLYVYQCKLCQGWHLTRQEQRRGGG